MTDPATVLQYVAGMGALYCATAYIYAFVIRSRGDRRWNSAGLLCTGIALASLAVVLPPATRGSGVLTSATTVLFLVLSVACQSFSAFRGRRVPVGTASERPLGPSGRS